MAIRLRQSPSGNPGGGQLRARRGRAVLAGGAAALAAGNQSATNSTIVTGTASASSVAGGITLPAASITILQTR